MNRDGLSLTGAIGRECERSIVGVEINTRGSSNAGCSKIYTHRSAYHFAQGNRKDKIGSTCVAFHQAYIVDGNGGGVIVGDGAKLGCSRSTYAASQSTSDGTQAHEKCFIGFYFGVPIHQHCNGFAFIGCACEDQSEIVVLVVVVGSSCTEIIGGVRH